jgi:putative transposase
VRKSGYSDEQIAAALGQAEIETTVVDITRMLGISEATFYVWKKQFVRRKTVLPHIRKVWQLSERRACEILGVNRRAGRYQSVCGDVDVALLARIKAIAAVRIATGNEGFTSCSYARICRLLSSVLLDYITKPV